MLAIASMIEACPPPTGHCIVEMGATADLIQATRDCKYNYSEPTGDAGFSFSIGYETPMRWSTISAKYRWSRLDEHIIGGEYMVNVIPMWIDSPVNLHVPVSMGYVHSASLYEHQGYFSSGLELNIGYLTSPIQGFIREDIGVKFIPGQYKAFHYVSVGFKLWLGKSW